MNAKTITAMEPYREYLDDLRQHHLSKGTLDANRYAFQHLTSFLDAENKRLQDITTGDLDRFILVLRERNLAAATIDMVARLVRLFFRHLAKTGRIFLDPAALWKLPKPPRPLLNAPTEKQIAALLKQPDIARPKGIRDRALIETAYSTGARREELYRLKLHDLDLDRGVIRVMGKGRKERMLPLGKHAAQWLRTYLRDARPHLSEKKPDEDRLWLATDGTPLEGLTMNRILAGYSIAANLPSITPHALRRACATHMLQHGAHPVQLQFLLGHADLRILSQYLRLTIRDIKKMHAAGKPGK